MSLLDKTTDKIQFKVLGWLLHYLRFYNIWQGY